MAQTSEIKLNKRFDQNIEVTGTITTSSDIKITDINSRHYIKVASSEWPEIRYQTPSHNETIRLGVAHSNNSGYSLTAGDFYVYSANNDDMRFIVPVGAGELKTQRNNNTYTILDTGNISSHIPSEYLTQTEGDARYLQSLPSHTHTILKEASSISYGTPGLQWFDLSGTGGAGTNNSTPANPFSDWHHHLIMNHANSAGYYVDMAYSFHNDRVHFRRNAGNSFGSWREFIHSGNIGSQSVNYAATAGSVSNADTVDGYHASSFFIDGDTVLNMANNDGLVYNDTNNLMYVKADGTDYQIIDTRGGTVSGQITASGGINMNNTNLSNVNHITINDAGAGEGIEWLNGNGWKIYESGNNLDNTSGNLQFVTGSTRRMTLNTSGILEVFGSSLEINGKYARDFAHSRYISGGGSLYGSGSSGWATAAKVTVTSNCSGAVLYGKMFSRAYHEAEIYNISVVIRAECDFTSNNESHFIEFGCTTAASSENTDYRNRIRAVLVESSTNRRTYEVQFFETAWNDNWWELWSSGFTIYETPQTPGTATGTARINYRSRLNADAVWARDGMYAPTFYDKDNTSYYLNASSTSNLNQLQLQSSEPIRVGTTSTALFHHYSNSTPVAFAMRKGGTTFSDGNSFGVLNLQRTNHNNSAGGAGASMFFELKDSGGTLREYAGITGRKTTAGTSGGQIDFHYYGRSIMATMNSSAFQHNGSVRGPIFYDSNDTNYFLNPASNGSKLKNITITPQSESWSEGIRFDMPTQGQWGGLRWARNGTSGNSGNWALGYAGNIGNSDDVTWWSGTGNHWWRMDHSGNVQIGGSSRAPIFYDLNNTGYYLNPASTSVLNGLTVYNTVALGNSIGDNITIEGQVKSNGSFVTTQDKIRQIDGENYFNINDDTTVEEFIEQWGGITSGSASNITKVDDNTAPAPGCFQFSGPTYSDIAGDYIKVDPYAEYTFEVWIKYVSGSGTDCRLYLGWGMYNASKSYFGNTQRYWGASALQVDSNTNNSGWIKVTGTISGIGSGTGQFISGTEYVKPLFLINYVVSGSVTTRLCGFKLYKSDKMATELQLVRKDAHVYRSKSEFNGNTSGYVKLQNSGGDILRIQSDTGYVNIGSDNASYCHFTTDRGAYYFDKNVHFDGILYDYDNTGYYVDPASTSILEKLFIYEGTNGAGAQIRFSDHASGSYAQYGTLEYVHADGSSYGSGNAFKFYGNQPSMSFHVAGKGLFTQDVIAYYSDMRLKTKIGDIQDPIGKIKALNGFYYEPNEVAESYGYEKERRIGLSAQEVQEVVPEAVTMAAIGDNYLSVDYAKLVPVLVEAIKELSNKVEDLENQLNGTEL